MGIQRLALVLSTFLFVTVVQEQAQLPTLHPEDIAGPWESTSASGIDGIFFKIEGSHEDHGVDIRVYHRQGAKETWGWFTTGDKASPELYNLRDDHSFTLFDGERLFIHFVDSDELKPFDLDVTFSPTAQHWEGSWSSRLGGVRHVVLKRPNPPAGAVVSAFVGDWVSEPEPDAPEPSATGTLHVRESSDGMLSAWLDSTISSTDARTRSVYSHQSSGEPLNISSATDTGLVLKISSTGGFQEQYRGSLSENRQELRGTWLEEIGRKPNAPARFRKAP